MVVVQPEEGLRGLGGDWRGGQVQRRYHRGVGSACQRRGHIAVADAHPHPVLAAAPQQHGAFFLFVRGCLQSLQTLKII